MTDPNKPVLLHVQGGSVVPSTDDGKNPSFMTIEFDAGTLLPVKMNTNYFDLVAANTADGSPVWQSYDYSEEF